MARRPRDPTSWGCGPSPSRQDIYQHREESGLQRQGREDHDQPDSAPRVIHRAIDHVPPAEAGTHHGYQERDQTFRLHILLYG